MSRAFVKEADGDVADELPERQISSHPNLVTARGLRLIEAEVERLRVAYAAARQADDRASITGVSRDLRYWTARCDSALLAPAAADSRTVVFGVRVTIEAAEGRRRTYRLVGGDEADPTQGRISWFAPLARALAGREVGESARAPKGEVEIVEIDAAPEA